MPGKTLCKFGLFISAWISGELLPRSPLAAVSPDAVCEFDDELEDEFFLANRGTATPATIPATIRKMAVDAIIHFHLFLLEL
jgi:hypothetical protein